MPGVETVHPVWTSGSNGYHDDSDSLDHDGGVANAPTQPDSGTAFWPMAVATKEYRLHRGFHEQYPNSPYTSSHLDQQVDSVHQPQNAVRVERLQGHIGTAREQPVFKPH